MKLRRVMIAAPKSGSGKTTITCAILQALKDSGISVVSYKCGPDYIDPMFHEKVIGVPSKNLDTFFTVEEETKALLVKNRSQEDFAVIEGVMGLFDGLGGIKEEGSSYHLAKVTKTPIILVIDAKGMGRSVVALISGFLAYDTEKIIKGVILNRMSKEYYDVIKLIIEQELEISVLGYFPEKKYIHIESRHLGLILPNELREIKEQLKVLSEEMSKTVSIKKIIQITENANELSDKLNKINTCDTSGNLDNKPVIAVARDEAFCFYYEDNLIMLQENGVELKFFSPIHDIRLPDNCNAVLFGGGYPELYAAELSSNISMCKSVKEAFSDGMPIVAECGGFMYLHSELVDKAGVSYALAGVVNGKCYDTGKLVRFGYIELQEKQSTFLPEAEKIKGHEFHYYDSDNNGESCYAVKPTSKKEYKCVIEGKNYWLGFPHLYYPSNPAFVKSFVEKAKEYRPERHD